MSIFKNKKGFTLVEAMVAALISSIVLGGIWLAFHSGFRIFLRGSRSLEEEMSIRVLFRRIEGDLRYLSRISELSDEEGEELITFDLIDKKVLETNEDTNDKTMEGWTITYESRPSTDQWGRDIVRLYRKVDKYTWKDLFGRDKDNNGDDEIPATEYIENAVEKGYDANYDTKNFDDDGLPDDCIDERDEEDEGDFEQQHMGRLSLVSVKFIPYDDKSRKIDVSGEWARLKGTERYALLRKPRTIEVIIEYVSKNPQISGERSQRVTHIVNLRNPSIASP
jgi:hypothetical protein